MLEAVKEIREDEGTLVTRQHGGRGDAGGFACVGNDDDDGARLGPATRPSSHNSRLSKAQ